MHTGSTWRIKSLSCRTARMMEKLRRGGDCCIFYRSWMCVTCWWWSPDGTVGFCWDPTALNTSTTVPGTSSSRRVTQTLQRKHPNQGRTKGQRARRQRETGFRLIQFMTNSYNNDVLRIKQHGCPKMVFVCNRV